MQVFKIVDTNEWKAAQEAGVYRGSAMDKKDGFIHLSTSAQLATTLTRWFAMADNLTLVALESDALSHALKWEAARDGELYPHLYRSIEISAVKWTSPIPRKAEGVFALPVQAFISQDKAPAREN